MPFLLTSDRTVVSAVKHAQWSPNKDLIGCLTQDCQLHAYREFPSFQRIWSLSFQHEPTALCWHPDGVRLALGHSNGSVSVIDAEDGRTEMQAIPQESAIVCITWMSLPAKQQSNAPLTHDMTARYMRHCPLDETFAESKGSSNGSSAAPAVDAKAVPRLVKHDFDALDILCTADTAGTITLSAFGHYPLLSFQLSSFLDSPSPGKSGQLYKAQVQEVLLCPRLSRIFVAYGSHRSSAPGVQPGTQGLLTCGLQAIGQCLSGLHSLLLIAATLRSLLADCKACMAAAMKQLLAVRRTFMKVLSWFAAPNGAPAPPGHWEAIKKRLCCELQALFTRGAESDALLTFLGSTPGEHGFKQAARSIDSAFNAAHSAAALPLKSALQGVLFVLDELTGLIHSGPMYNGLGLKQEGLSAIKAETASLLVRLEALQEMITNVACLHRIFFQWLVARARAQGGAVSEGTAVSDAGDGEHQHALNMFLEHCIVADPLMEELENGVLPRPGALRPDRRPRASRNIPQVMDLLNIAMGCPEPKAALPLPAALERLASDVTEIFSEVPSVLCRFVTLESKVTLGGKDANCAAASGPSLSLRANSAPTPSPQASLDGGQAATGHQKTPDSRIEVIFQFVATVNCADHADCVAQLAIEYDSTNAGLSSVRGALLSCGEDGSGFEVVAARCFQKDSLVLLLRSTAAGEGGSLTRQAHVCLVSAPFSSDVHAHLSKEVQGDCVQMFQALVAQGAVVSLDSVSGVQMQQTPSAAVNTPLAVSVARALAAVCAQQRITVYDLNDDDEEEEGNEEDLEEDSEDLQEVAIAASNGNSSESAAEMSS